MKIFQGLVFTVLLSLCSFAHADKFAYIASGINNDQPNAEVAVVNTDTGQLVNTLTLPEEAPAIAVLPNSDGTRVYVVTSTASGNTYIHIIDATSNSVVGTTMFSQYDPNDPNSGVVVDAAVLSKDDRWLILAANPYSTFSGYSIYLIDLINGGTRYPVYTFGDGGIAQSMTISPDGKFVAIVRSGYWTESIHPTIENKGRFSSFVTLLDLERVTDIISAATELEVTQLEVGVDANSTTLSFLRSNGISGDNTFPIPAPSDPNKENASAGIVFSPDPKDPETLRLFVANSWADTVSVLKINPIDSDAWLSNFDNYWFDPNVLALYQQFPSRFQLEQTITPIQFDEGSAPYSLAVTPDNKTLFVSLSQRWNTEWNSSQVVPKGYLAYVDVESTTNPDPATNIPLNLWSPKYTSVHPRAISYVERDSIKNEGSLAFIKEIKGSTYDSSRDSYIVSTIDILQVPQYGTIAFSEGINTEVSSSNNAPIIFNGDFVGEDCESCSSQSVSLDNNRLDFFYVGSNVTTEKVIKLQNNSSKNITPTRFMRTLYGDTDANATNINISNCQKTLLPKQSCKILVKFGHHRGQYVNHEYQIYFAEGSSIKLHLFGEILPLNQGLGETLGMPDGEFYSGSIRPWSARKYDAAHDKYMVSSNSVCCDKSSVLYTYLEAGTLEFNWSTVDANSKDMFEIYINGTLMSSIRGNQAWQTTTLKLESNRNHVVWRYTVGSDGSPTPTAMLNNVSFQSDNPLNLDEVGKSKLDVISLISLGLLPLIRRFRPGLRHQRKYSTGIPS